MRCALPFLLLASTTQAGTFSPPEGCTAHLTVQARSCLVTHYWTCTGNAPGEQWSGELNQDGLVYVGKIDHEAQWLKSYFIDTAEEETLILPAADPANLTALLATGLDTYDFTLDTTTGVHRVVGFDRITQRDVTIDGEVLHRTAFDITITNVDSDVIFAAEGVEYVSAKHRRFFSGAGKITAPDAPLSYDETVVEFITRGQPGFLSDTPKYDCTAVTAQLEIKQEDPQP